MITRDDILKEIKKNKGKTKEAKKQAISEWLDTKNLGKKKHWRDGYWTEEEEKDLIMADLDSYEI